MKKTIFLLVVMIMITLLAGCDDSLTEMNIDHGRLSELPDEYLFTSAVHRTINDLHTEYDTRFGCQYAHIYVINSEFRSADSYLDYHLSDVYRQIFNYSYIEPLRYINRVVSMTSEGKTKNPVRNAIARIVAVVEYSRITDCFGDVPYFEGARGMENILYPKYDGQELIYHDMMDQLKSAIEILKTANTSQGYVGADPVYGNNLNKWSRFANSLRLRLAMRSRFVDPAGSATVIADCMNKPFIENNDENFGLKFQVSDNGELYNPWYETRKRQNWKMSDKFVEWLKSTNDPRLRILVDTTKTGEYKGFINGLTDQEQSKYQWEDFSDPKPALYAKDMTINLMCASEVWFLRAEAALFSLTAGNPQQLYQEGIRKNMLQWSVPAAEITEYLSTEPEATLNGSDENKFRQIATQMWVAFTPNFVEAWSNMRRTGYPVIPQRTDANVYALGATNGILPKRFKYSSSEYLTNKANLDVAIEQQGPDLIDTPVWWDVREK
ncbi:MAG: SusD/RagB family nutrient-binding outer membrane lipoprotein [Bacteroidales bacterium]|nr:SusD/RagB family nutrient-binding outer membrane lipoprotein [Bacteroidales bacterium]